MDAKIVVEPKPDTPSGKYFARYDPYVDLFESPTGWGATEAEAIADLERCAQEFAEQGNIVERNS